MSKEITVRTVWATEHAITVEDEFTPTGDPAELPAEVNPANATAISYSVG